MKKFGKRTWIALVAVLAVAVAAVGGYAYWTSTGSGSGSVTVGTDTPWQVDVSPASGAPLAPGGPVQVVGYTVTNNGSGNQALSGVTVSVAESNGSAWDGPGNCSAADFSVNGAPAGTAAFTTALAQVFGAGGSSSASVTVQMVETNANQNDCRNAHPPLLFVAG
jgi:hypothetical protein